MTLPATGSITAVRSHLRAYLHAPLVVFAVDGVAYELARSTWRQATLRGLTSTFPSTSSCAWLSSLTGLSVAEHGVPGVLFKWPERGGALVNIFHEGPYESAVESNLFSDAVGSGGRPVACGDFDETNSFWRHTILRHAAIMPGQRYFGHDDKRYVPDSADRLIRRIEQSVRQCLTSAAGAWKPCLLWCFIEVDRHVHRYGYDAHVLDVLSQLDRLAASLADEGVRVVAYSDHGLVPTATDENLSRLLQDLESRYGVQMGGAGRTRWLYLRSPRDRAAVWERLCRHDLPDIDLGWSHDYFPEGSLAERRVGDIVLIAKGERFLRLENACFDHGSLLPSEMNVPFAVWENDAPRN